METWKSAPFEVLTFVVAPAVPRNATSILRLSMSNHFALGIDQVRKSLSHPELRRKAAILQSVQRTSHLRMARRRVAFVVRALTALDMAFGSFVAGSVIELVGALPLAAAQERLRFQRLVCRLVAGVTRVRGRGIGCLLRLRASPLARLVLADGTNFLKRQQPDAVMLSMHDPRRPGRAPHASH